MTQSPADKARQAPEILQVKRLASTELFYIEALTLRFSNGAVRTFERFKPWHPGTVMVLPLYDPNTLLLIREYNAGTEEYSLSFPKGRVEQGETPCQAAGRELQEETGYAAKQLTLLKSVTNSPSYSSTRMHLILAQSLDISPLPGDEPEPLEVVPWPLSEITQLLERDDFHEARAMAALYLLQQHFRTKNKV